MLKISGKSISGMVTIGPLKIFRHQEFDIVQTTVDRPETEVARFDSCKKHSMCQNGAVLSGSRIPCRS